MKYTYPLLFEFFLKRRDTIATLVDQVMVSGGNFLTIAICAHFLPLAEQGKLTYVFATYMGLLLFNVASIYQGAAVRAPRQGLSYPSTLIKLQLTLALLMAFVACLFWGSFGHLLGWAAKSTEIVLLFIFLALQQFADFMRRSAYIFKTVQYATAASILVYSPRVVLLLVMQVSTLYDVLIIMILSASLPAFANFMGIKKALKGGSAWAKQAIDHLVYSRMFILGAPLAWMWSYIPIFLLGAMVGKEEAAVLASIRGVSNIANVLMEQLETRVVSEWARKKQAEDQLSVQCASSKLFRLGITLWFVGFLAVIFFGAEIIKLVLGKAYVTHWGLLVIVWLSYGVYFVSRVMGIKQRVFGSNKIEFFANATGAAVALIASTIAIPGLSTVGAAWVYVLIPVAMVASQLYFIRTEKI